MPSTDSSGDRGGLFEPEHEAFRDTVGSFIEAEVRPHYDQWEGAKLIPREFHNAAGKAGLLGFAVPEEFEGPGVADFRFNAVVNEEFARVGMLSAGLSLTLTNDVALPYLTELASAEQQARWLPGVVSGDNVLAIAMTEPGTGSDLSGIRTKARLEGDEYVVNGSKTFITNGQHADLVVTAVRTGDHPHKGLSLLVIEGDSPGFTRGRNLSKIGLHSQDTSELIFSDVRVPVANRLGEEGTGFGGLMANLPQERLSISVSAVACAEGALARTLAYVKERKAFGQPVGNFQNSRFLVAELDTELTIARVYVDDCIRRLNAGTLTAVDAAKAKWWTTELQNRVVDRCLQLHGGYGYMTEYQISRDFLDARVQTIYGGTTEIMKEIVGRSHGL